MGRKPHASVAVCAATVLGVTAAPPAATCARPAEPAVTALGADFNGDGYPDLAIDAHGTASPRGDRTGAVAVAYGSPTGLRFDTASIIRRTSAGVPGDPVGQVAGYGDLDADGYDDLVVQSGQETTVLWGGRAGITGIATVLRSGTGSPASPTLLDGGLGVGDVNGDRVDDLVSRAGGPGSSGLAVLFGPIQRGTGRSAGTWYRDTAALDGVRTGTLYVGDLTGDGVADIVVAGESAAGGGATGGVVLKGSFAGLLPGSAYPAPYRAGTVYPSAFGDLNRDGYRDLVVGVPERNTVHVAYGGPAGIAADPAPRAYTQASSGVPGTDEPGDRFGSAVAVGDLDADGHADVVIGASHETGADPATTARSGAVTVLRGCPAGITGAGAASLTQNTPGVPSVSENDDHFGAAVKIVDMDRNGSPELYVGSDGEDVARGRVWRLLTGPSGVTGTGATSFKLSDLGGRRAGGGFGFRLAG